MDHTHLHPWLDGLSSYAQLISYTPCDQGCAAQLVEADALRDYLQHERIMLFGFGYGGLLAQAYTLRFPKRVMGVILCSLPVNDGNTAVANLFNQLYQIEAPTLILAGRRDTICPPDQTAERCHASLPNSRLVIFDESGHCPFVDEGERFTAVVGSWLSQFDKT
jgi:pimeloyl-ACP methyl ester carboxylesterase